MEELKTISVREFLNITKEFIIENNCVIREPVEYLRVFCSNYDVSKTPEDITKFWKKYGKIIVKCDNELEWKEFLKTEIQ